VSSLHQGFQDTGQDPQAAFRWLDGADAHPLVKELKGRMLELCPVRAGDQVLDVGCGAGHEVRRLAQTAGSQGRAVGIDASALMIAEASRRADGR
jgi:ubiquinone/menaquinone biosynthesis C-methylase UbiE